MINLVVNGIITLIIQFSTWVWECLQEGWESVKNFGIWLRTRVTQLIISCWDGLTKTWKSCKKFGIRVKEFLGTNSTKLRVSALVLATGWFSVSLALMIWFTQMKAKSANPLEICDLPFHKGNTLIVELREKNRYLYVILCILTLVFGFVFIGHLFLLDVHIRKCLNSSFRTKNEIFLRKFLLEPQKPHQLTFFFTLSVLLSLIPNLFKNYDYIHFASALTMMVWVFLLQLYFQPKSDTGLYGSVVSSGASILLGVIQCYPTRLRDILAVIVGFILFVGLHYYYQCLTYTRNPEQLGVPLGNSNIITEGYYRIREVNRRDLAWMKDNIVGWENSVFHIVPENSVSNNQCRIVSSASFSDDLRECVRNSNNTEWNHLLTYYTLETVAMRAEDEEPLQPTRAEDEEPHQPTREEDKEEAEDEDPQPQQTREENEERREEEIEGRSEEV